MNRSKPVREATAGEWLAASDEARAQREPVVVRGVLPAEMARRWTPRRFAELYGNNRYSIAIDLPEGAVPYELAVERHQRLMTVTELVDAMEAGLPCYLNQVRARDFGAFMDDLDLAGLRIAPVFATNLWIGFKTSSGLHYDRADNVLAQVHGTKRVTLVAPRYSRLLHPLPDNPSKSAVNVRAVEEQHREHFERCELLTCAIEPGDALFIPRGWWHDVASAGAAVSVNCWHGNTLSDRERGLAVLAAGPRAVTRTVRDFVVFGVLGRPYEARMFSPKPLGVRIYERMPAILRGKNKA